MSCNDIVTGLRVRFPETLPLCGINAIHPVDTPAIPSLFVAVSFRKSYLNRLERYRAKFHVRIYAYCLMPNHVHLLLESGSEPLSKFMQGLQQSYTQYFNRSYRKVGHLFQGRYKAIICDKDKYLLALPRYIHLNPVRAGLAKRPEGYVYPGHRSYLIDGAAKIVESGPIWRMKEGSNLKLTS